MSAAIVNENASARYVEDPNLARRNWWGWIPLLVLPAATIGARPFLQPWIFMWILAAAIFFGCKWQAWWEWRSISCVSIGRSIGFLFAWPGMDAAAFLSPEKHPQRPASREWIAAITKTILGALLIWVAVPRVPRGSDLLAGWMGMLGLILMLHFGSFHILSLLWRSAGVDATPIMRAPLLAASLSDFWGRRWNLGFRQLTHRLIFRPVRALRGVPAATMLSFVASGVIHDLVISLPARGGYGLPTCYFALQGLGVLLERSWMGRALKIQSGLRGWLFAVVCAGGPACLLFHPAFVRVVMLPCLAAMGAR